MSLTPMDLELPADAHYCSVCGNHLSLNNRAITFHSANRIVVGNCCADYFFGSFVQDYALALGSNPEPWVTNMHGARLRRVTDGLDKVREVYAAMEDSYGR